MNKEKLSQKNYLIMTTGEKEILLKDLCARLPYGVIAYASEINKNGIITDVNIPYNMVNLTVDNADGKYELVPLFDIKPYLRPMYSMSEEEKKEFQACHCVYGWHPDFQPMMCNLANECNMFDWLIAHHFDYRGLIPKGLALEAPENMYKEK